MEIALPACRAQELPCFFCPESNYTTDDFFPSLEASEFGDRVRQFTVKVFGEESWGSGAIVARHEIEGGEDRYIVATNSHVLRDETVQIQTDDGQIYDATIELDDRVGGYDLAFLSFTSDRNLRVASVQTQVSPGERTFATGYPFVDADRTRPENSKFRWTQGELTYALDEPLVDGYRYAYSNPIMKGMSGGPVVNLRGELIAINGLHAYPLWGDPFVYPDGRSIPEDLREMASASSWSIPIDSALERGAEFFPEASHETETGPAL
ncbi:MAG: serine protease [Geitlerinemataceae cyanobacterium]